MSNLDLVIRPKHYDSHRYFKMGKEQAMIFSGGMSSCVIFCGMMGLSMNPWEQVASATNFLKGDKEH